uniref:Uncharacterized protein n=1 Tax=Peronospora matthiolae TaxID=2874970 RepID=A0AAV1TXH9_9STRA
MTCPWFGTYPVNSDHRQTGTPMATNVPEWSKGVDSSSTAFALVCSNPTADT